ncbi:MAG: M23 family metallopeptidase [Spirochaetota bacterium]
MKTVTWVISFILIANFVPKRSTQGKEYIICGNNSQQKIYYATSSNFSKNHKGHQALDDDETTSWISTRGGEQWIEIDFGVKRILTDIEITAGTKDNYNTITYCILQFMYDGKWFDFLRVNFIQKDKKGIFGDSKYQRTVKVNLKGIDASTFRIYIPQDATIDGYAAIAEIAVYAGSAKLQYFDKRLYNLCFPIKNGLFPENDSGYPNAPRGYRGGTHYGLDIFYYYNEDNFLPIPVDENTPVLACNDGVVVRADIDYEPPTEDEWKSLSQYYQKNPATFIKRSFGGRQVWIDHGNGILSTYNHLSKIDEKIKVGTIVKKGQRIGWVGNSGLLGEAQGNKGGQHLHFELWVDGVYLGYNMSLNDIKRYLRWIFAIREMEDYND